MPMIDASRELRAELKNLRDDYKKTVAVLLSNADIGSTRLAQRKLVKLQKRIEKMGYTTHHIFQIMSKADYKKSTGLDPL